MYLYKFLTVAIATCSPAWGSSLSEARAAVAAAKKALADAQAKRDENPSKDPKLNAPIHEASKALKDAEAVANAAQADEDFDQTELGLKKDEVYLNMFEIEKAASEKLHAVGRNFDQKISVILGLSNGDFDLSELDEDQLEVGEKCVKAFYDIQNYIISEIKTETSKQIKG